MTCRAARLLLTRPEALTGGQQETFADITAARQGVEFQMPLTNGAVTRRARTYRG